MRKKAIFLLALAPVFMFGQGSGDTRDTRGEEEANLVQAFMAINRGYLLRGINRDENGDIGSLDLLSLSGITDENRKSYARTVRVEPDRSKIWKSYLDWEDGRIKSYGGEWLAYDSVGRVADKYSNVVSYGKKYSRWHEFFEYYDNGDIKSVKECMDLGKGNEDFKPKERIPKKIYTYKYYKEDSLEVIEEEYHNFNRTKKGYAKDKGELYRYLYSISGGGCYLENQRIDTESGELWYRSRRYCKGAVLQKLSVDNFASGERTVSVYAFDTLGRVKEEHKTFEAGGRIEWTSECVWSYASETDRKGSYMDTTYDRDGKVLSQTDGKMMREMANGAWGPWKYLRY